VKTVKFKKAGRWAEMDPRDPHFSVKAGEKKPVSDGLAAVVVKAGAGEIVVSKAEKQADDLKAKTNALNMAKSVSVELDKLASAAEDEAKKVEALVKELSGPEKAAATKEAKKLRGLADKAAADAKDARENADKAQAEVVALLDNNADD